MENAWDVVTRVRWRLNQPKPLLYTPIGLGFSIVWAIFVILFSIWSVLLALRLDGLLSWSWRQVWAPIFALLAVFYLTYVKI